MNSSGIPIWNNASLRSKGLLVLVLPLIVLVAALLAATAMEHRTREAEARVQRSIQIRSDARHVLALLTEAEAAMRGYLLTGKEQYLESYQAALAALPSARQRLVPEGDAFGSEALREIQGLIDRDLALLERQRTAPASAVQDLLAESKVIMDRLRVSLGEMERGLGVRLGEDWSGARRRHHELFLVVLVSSLFGPIAGLLANLLLTASLSRRIRELEENSRLLAKSEPLRPLPAGRDEIARLGQSLEEAAGLLNLRERRLSASEQRFRSLFEGAPVAYQEIDSEGVIRRVNEAECRLLGYSAGELLGRPVWELVVPEQQQASRESVRRKMSGEQSIEVFERDYVR
ncbi:MAG TPA: PAS domain S-box protein, partial [Bryobacteraceae bacterium]|nr:PAS domain S-box protein [Bryobacteraceae bacterium]